MFPGKSDPYLRSNGFFTAIVRYFHGLTPFPVT